MFKEAVIDQRLGAFTHSLQLLRRGLHRLDATKGPSAAAVRSKLATRYGFGRYLQGRAREAIRWCRVGAEEALRAADKATLAMSYNALFLAYLRSGTEPDAPYGRLALELYEEIDDLSGQGHCANNLAIAAHGAGNWSDAEQLFGRAAEIFARIGDVSHEANAVYNRCDLLVRQGRFTEAEPLLRDVLRTAQAVHDGELIALALRERARACAGLDSFDEAWALFDDAGKRFDELGLGHERIALDGAVAEAQLRAGDAAESLPLLDHALARAAETGAADLAPALHRLRALALIEVGRLDDANAAIDAASAADEGADGGYERAMLLRAKARLDSRRGGADMQHLDESSAEILRALGVLDGGY
jgi:tetratricopeptide (TPR) repeat protein